MLPREFRHPLFVAGVAAYGLVQFNRFVVPGLLLPLLTSYLADLVCLPLELTVALVGLRRLYFRRPGFVLPTAWIFSTWVVTALWFELALPHLQPSATADPLDVVAYALGALAFGGWLNRPA
ncbi:hypothetical protein [Hymenobacter persicinus]|uniref:Magnesium citrate secondary transporter n=1 Tax=Hymenobacter persicinus TaxID=2025506 RepID=A0A4Q5LF91_9BACT|nr:hypothetical protein [Hymenobacter persicinus]RYU81279.1 hypothetical protein EWM57_06800 [Hymenobacter persicinus]